jgi:SlyX protein
MISHFPFPIPRMHMDTPARLTELEIKLSYTEDLVEELNQAVSRQQVQISLLQDQLRTVFQQMRQMAPGEQGDQGDPREDVPPHY